MVATMPYRRSILVSNGKARTAGSGRNVLGNAGKHPARSIVGGDIEIHQLTQT